MTAAPRSISVVRVGSDARIFPSSVIVPAFIGTFRSRRTRTRRPPTIRSSMSFTARDRLSVTPRPAARGPRRP